MATTDGGGKATDEEVTGLAPEAGVGERRTRGRTWTRPVLHLAILVPLAFAAFFFRLGDADWKDAVQANAGQIVQEMVSGEGWVLPLQNERHIPVKPPLFYWLGGLSAVARGSGGDLLDARLPSAVLGAFCVIVVYFFARRLTDDRVALWSAVILISTPQFFTESRNSRVDIALCLFLTSGLFLLHRIWEGDVRRNLAGLAGLCLGLATLSKGPLALALAVMVFAVTLPLAPPRTNWRALLSPWLLVPAVALPAAWYAAATYQHGLDFLKIHFYAENVSRLMGKQGEWPIWFYVEPFITKGLPWILLIPWVMKEQSALPARSRRFLWVWVLAMLVFFSLSPGKRRAYLLPLRPPLAILLAAWLAPRLAAWRGLRREAPPPPTVHLGIGILVLAALGAVVALAYGVSGFGRSEIQWSYWWRVFLQENLLIVAGFVAAIGIGADLAVTWAWRRRLDLAGYALAATVVLGLTLGASSTSIVQGEGGSFRPFAANLQARVGESEPLAFLDFDDVQAVPLLFHLRRHIPVVESRGQCTPPRPGLYLIQESRWNEEACFRTAQWEEILRGGPAVRSQRWRRLVLARHLES